MRNVEYDVFISHASEDKKEFLITLESKWHLV